MLTRSPSPFCKNLPTAPVSSKRLNAAIRAPKFRATSSRNLHGACVCEDVWQATPRRVLVRRALHEYQVSLSSCAACAGAACAGAAGGDDQTRRAQQILAPVRRQIQTGAPMRVRRALLSCVSFCVFINLLKIVSRDVPAYKHPNTSTQIQANRHVLGARACLGARQQALAPAKEALANAPLERALCLRRPRFARA